MRTLGLVLVAALAISGCFGVDRNNFKTCEQSGFCKRLRALKPEKSQYVLNLDTVIVHGNVLSAEVNTMDYEGDKKVVLWHYALRLSALVDGTFRIEIDEADPLYPRYRTQLALDGEPAADGLRLASNENGKLTLINTQGHKVVITADPLKFEFLNQKGEVAVVVNENSQLFVEPLRVRKERVDDEDGQALDVEDESAWSENFKTHHDRKPRGNEAVSVDVSFPDADHVYGIPQHTDRFFLKTTTDGEPYRLYNLDVFEYELDSRMAIYGAVPVMYAHGSSRSAGVFWHNSAETWVDVVNYAEGNVVSSLVNLVTGGQKRKVDARFMSESGIVDVFVLLGDRPADVFRQYTRLTGAAPLPPKFSLAYHQSRWNYVDEADVRSVDENFDAHDIPADVIWLDIEYTDRKKYFTWDPEKFPRPAEMVANLTAKGRKLVVIIDPHIKREAGYFVHEDAQDNSYYVKDKDGKDYDGWCWPGSSSYLDFFNPAASKYYAERYRFENFPGTSKDVHFWNDMNEPSVFSGPEITMPKDNRHYAPPVDGADGLSSFWEHRHVHNEYGLWHIRATKQGAMDRTNGKYRAFILTRATFAGTQRYAAVWTGDNMAEWGHLAATVPMCLSLGAAGISHCGADVGGFFKYPESELMTRWYQAGAFQPFFRAHSHIETKRREPWLYEPATTALLRDANRRRYALIDFWYTLFYEHSIDGLPVMRPLWQEFPEERDTYAIDDQYLLGDKLLVRPVTEPGVSSVKVYLPGKDARVLWYDVDTYKMIPAQGYLNQDVNIAKIPVYQRGGSVVPRKERVRRSSALMADDPYTLVVALDHNNTATGTLYIDDGETTDYTDSQYIYAKITYEPSAMTYSFVNENAHFPTRSWLERIVIAGIKTPPKTAKLHQEEKQTALQMTLHKGNDVLVVRKPGASMAKPWKITFSY
ncbi:neutral alpha-glucosidase AB isoform X2 [Pectinophora gossypiella]|uniref:neutral alpha-glucosidase AB isoform X2 n=1 Tax=Pectinophora gossypiella TaxID=13191 RepID=UPI00214EFDBA|nr:neutral alpha-glucosidase AB isoform X2 [Pectinophora gossypiella]